MDNETGAAHARVYDAVGGVGGGEGVKNDRGRHSAPEHEDS